MSRTRRRQHRRRNPRGRCQPPPDRSAPELGPAVSPVDARGGGAGVALGLVVVFATDQVLPASTDRQAELRFWLAARATGVVALLLLTLQVAIGLVLSHPHNKTTWKLSKTIFPWHDHLWVFVIAFLVAHIVSLVVDPKAGVSLTGRSSRACRSTGARRLRSGRWRSTPSS